MVIAVRLLFFVSLRAKIFITILYMMGSLYDDQQCSFRRWLLFSYQYSIILVIIMIMVMKVVIIPWYRI